ncbi:MAG: VOC family protein [Micropruina sp.]|uniref:VOC family protein n=1 Tax=Micropruina sp. TaxID=2737536 RepID=UPI0039E4B2CF
MTIAISRCFVAVTDVDAALTFYRDLLGMEVQADVAQGEFRWITVAAPGQDGMAIVLSNYLADAAADAETLRSLLAKGALSAAHFRSDDLDGLFARLADAGVEVLEQPTDQFWGVRDCAVRDPSGNVIRIDQA